VSEHDFEHFFDKTRERFDALCSAGLTPGEAAAELVRRSADATWAAFNEAADAGDYSKALDWLGSEHVADDGLAATRMGNGLSAPVVTHDTFLL